MLRIAIFAFVLAPLAARAACAPGETSVERKVLSTRIERRPDGGHGARIVEETYDECTRPNGSNYLVRK